MSIRERKSIFVGLAAFVALLLLISGNIQAGLITYSCTAGNDCNGNVMQYG
jgi:hypothetical protein